MGRSCRTGGVFPSHHRLSAPVPGRLADGSVEDMIEIHGLTKRYGATTAVSDLTFTVQPGTVTGFLGPNGAGKSTTMRMILGLDQPTSGSVLVNGRPPRAHAAPLHEVGALLEARLRGRGQASASDGVHLDLGVGGVRGGGGRGRKAGC